MSTHITTDYSDLNHSILMFFDNNEIDNLTYSKGNHQEWKAAIEDSLNQDLKQQLLDRATALVG